MVRPNPQPDPRAKSKLGKSRKPDKKRRSPWERIIVWAGIAILLLVVLAEWSSKTNYQKSFQALDSQIKGVRETGEEKSVTLDEAKKNIFGYAVQTEVAGPDIRKIKYRWPSLFKTYQLLLTVTPADHVTMMESVVADDKSAAFAKPVATQTNVTKPVPRDGRVPIGANVVAMTISDYAQPPAMGYRIGSLTREIIRQAFLIAARDEMGLCTRDGATGEIVLVSDPAAPTFPVEFLISLQVDLNKAIVNLEASRPIASGKWLNWESGPMQFKGPLRLEDLLTSAEAWSRKEFVQVLRQAGFQKRASTPSDAVDAGSDVKEHLDVIAQYSFLRKLHAERRSKGESDANLGGLIRTYANLGDLTNCYCTPMFKAFKARSLLYSQRYLALRGTTPGALAHRAYAYALCGDQNKALNDLKAARGDGKTTVPDWLPVIDAFCHYKPESLQQVTGPNRELALYLNMRMSDPENDELSAARAIERYINANLAPFRGFEMMFETRALGRLRHLTEEAIDERWKRVYERIAEIPTLPPDAKAAASTIIGNSKKVSLEQEHRSRVQLISSLRQAGSSSSDESEPSWLLLAEMLHETNFNQAWHTLEVEDYMLGVDPTDTMKTLLPLVQGHRYQKLIEGFSGDRQANSKHITELANAVKPWDCELSALPIQRAVFRKLDPQKSGETYRQMLLNADYLFDDQLRLGKFAEYPKSEIARALRELAPHQPISAAYAITHNWEKDGSSHAKEWEKTFQNSPSVMLALGNAYQTKNQFEDARRCFENSVARSPTFEAYQALADLYEKLGDLTASQNALEEALELPDFGLKGPMVEVKLARNLMKKGDWEGAREHAIEAARSGSAWGMDTLARCAEGLGDWKLAEAVQRQKSERYADCNADWYFWCVRTQKGNLNQAKGFAQTLIGPANPSQNPGEIEAAAIAHRINGDFENAAAAYAKIVDLPKTQFATIMIAAALNETLQKNEIRDAYWDKIVTTNQKAMRQTLCVDLIDLFRRILKSRDGKWDAKAFDDIVLRYRTNEITAAYYLAGVFLQNRKQNDLADDYLTVAATSFEVERFSCLLATVSLREQKKKIGLARSSEYADWMIPILKLVNDATSKRDQSKFDEAAQHLKEALALKPGLAAILRERAHLNRARGEVAAAAADYDEILRQNPDCDCAHRDWAWMLATCEDDKARNATEAMKHAQAAIRLRVVPTWQNLSALAAAKAEAGDFAEALETERKALQLSFNNSQILQRIEVYRSEKAFRTSSFTP